MMAIIIENDIIQFTDEASIAAALAIISHFYDALQDEKVKVLTITSMSRPILSNVLLHAKEGLAKQYIRKPLDLEGK
jgi:hypothetical protein